MYKVKFDNGYVASFENEPTQEDIESASEHMAQNLKPAPASEQPKGFFSGAANLINKGVNAMATAVDYTGLPKATGLAVGALGGLEGGIVGAVGTPIKNAIQSKPLLQDLGKNIMDTAKSTAGFGYDIGHAGAETAPLGALGKLGVAGRTANLAIAYGQGYQGVGDIVEGVKSGDTALATQGAGELGMSALAAYSGAKGMGKAIDNVKNTGWKAMLIDPEVIPEFQKLQREQQVKAAQKIEQVRKTAYDNLYRQTQPEIKRELLYGKDIIGDLKDSGVSSDTYMDASKNVRLSNGKAIEDLTPRRDAAFKEVQTALEANRRDLNLINFQKQAIENFKKYNGKTLDTLTENEAIKQIKSQVAADIVKNGEERYGFKWKGSTPEKKIAHAKVNEVAKAQQIDSVELSNKRTGFWNMSNFTKDPNTRTPQQRVGSSLGNTVAQVIEETYKDSADIHSLNRTVGKYSDMIKFLQASEGRTVPQGSAMRGLLRRTTGAIVGAVAGHAIPVPGVGPALGAVVGDKIGGAVVANPGAKVKSLNAKAAKLQAKIK